MDGIAGREFMPTPAEPGFYIVQDPMPRGSLEHLLMPEASSATLGKFRSLNPHLSQWAKPGQMAVMSASTDSLCTLQEGPADGSGCQGRRCPGAYER